MSKQLALSSDRVLIALSLFASVAYMVPRASGAEGWWVVVLKGLAISPLAALAFLRYQGGVRWLLGLGLAFSSLGDVLLAVSGRDLFLFGLLAFLVAHLLYIVLFHRLRSPRGELVGARIGGVVVLAVAMVAWLWSDLGELRVPVMVYVTAIATMAATAQRTASSWIAGGALLFVVSDAVLAIGRFQGPFPLSATIVWVTYVAAQLAIVAGVLGRAHDT